MGYLQFATHDYSVACLSSLVQFFSTKKKYAGMAARLCNKYFLNDLALTTDILNEISTALQTRS